METPNLNDDLNKNTPDQEKEAKLEEINQKAKTAEVFIAQKVIEGLKEKIATLEKYHNNINGPIYEVNVNKNDVLKYSFELVNKLGIVYLSLVQSSIGTEIGTGRRHRTLRYRLFTEKGTENTPDDDKKPFRYTSGKETPTILENLEDVNLGKYLYDLIEDEIKKIEYQADEAGIDMEVVDRIKQEKAGESGGHYKDITDSCMIILKKRI